MKYTQKNPFQPLIGNLILIVLFFVTTAVYAQPNRDNGKRTELLEKYKSQKIAYLTTKLSLTPEEATKFWPIYNQYADEKENLQRKISEEIRAQKLNDRNPDASLSNMFAFKEEDLAIEKKYTAKFKDALPSDKILKLFYHEKEFRKELAERMKSRMKDRRPNRD